MTLGPLELSVLAHAARDDFRVFVLMAFRARRGLAWRMAPHHRQIIDALMRVYRGECTRLVINIPPRYSKTELAVLLFIAWTLGRHPDAEYIHASYSATLATNNSAAVRDLVQHEHYRAAFPGVQLATEARHHWTTTAGGVVYAAGTAGTITGFGAGKMRAEWGGAIVIDDPHKADEARSDVVRKGVIDWFQNTLESRKNDPARTPIIVIMQRLHEDDLAGWLMAGGNGEQWESLVLSAVRDDGEPLWPEKHAREDLARMELAMPYTFAGQYRQRPSPPEGGIFKPDQIEIIPAVPTGARWVRGWDLGGGVDGDPTAGALLGLLPSGLYVIADMVHLQDGPDRRDAAMLNAARRDGKLVRVSIPQDPGQAGKGQVLQLTRLLAGYPVHSSPESGDKITRAEGFASQVNVGNVAMVRGSWNAALIEEMRLFPNASHDDRVDALSRAFAALTAPRPHAGALSVAGL